MPKFTEQQRAELRDAAARSRLEAEIESRRRRGMPPNGSAPTFKPPSAADQGATDSTPRRSSSTPGRDAPASAQTVAAVDALHDHELSEHELNRRLRSALERERTRTQMWQRRAESLGWGQRSSTGNDAA